MPDLILLEKDLGYTEKKLDELVSDFKNRAPANKTQDFITEVKITMKEQSVKLDDIASTLNSHIKEQRDHEDKIAIKLEESKELLATNFREFQTLMTTFIESSDRRFSSLENWKSWVIGIFSVLGVVIALVVYIYINDIGQLKTEIQKHVENTNNLIK